MSNDTTKHRCAFCGADTTFLAHSPHLCLRCGDAVQDYTPEQALDMAKRFAECVTTYRRKGEGGER